VNRARVDDRIWRQVVELFVPRVYFAIVDLSDYEVESELGWELTQLKAGGVPALFICREEEQARAEEELNRLGWGKSPRIVEYDPRNPDYGKLIAHLAAFSKVHQRKPKHSLSPRDSSHRSVEKTTRL